MVDKKDLRIVFLGTPEFAVASLKALIEDGYNVVGVITAPDRKGGRGMKQIITSAIKKYALSKELKVMQPTNLKSETFQQELKSLHADVQVIVAFRMLPEAVWDMPPYGTYNLHGSLLPKYRGAAPINWAIMRGEEYTGVTTFKLKHEIDTGSIVYQEKIPIAKNAYLNDVHDLMMEVGAQLVIKTMSALCQGSISLIEQDPKGITKAPKLYHKNCKIDWDHSTEEVYNMVRGLSPYPVAWTELGERKLKIFRCRYTYHHHRHKTGSYHSDGKSFLSVACKDGLIFLDEVQHAGKKRMPVRDFLNGINLKENKLQLPIQIGRHW